MAESPSHPELVDRGVVELAEERGCTPLDVMLDISLDDDLKARFWSVLANNDPEAIAWLLPRDNVLLGLADSGAHVSQLCDACFATDLLGNWVRDRGVMPLERAVHKLTAEPAGVYGLTDRGTVEVGKAADLCVFDPATVAPGPLRRVYDFPADGERLTADEPVGMTHVLVNGVPIRVDGEPVPDGLDSRPGNAAAQLTYQRPAGSPARSRRCRTGRPSSRYTVWVAPTQARTRPPQGPLRSSSAEGSSPRGGTRRSRPPAGRCRRSASSSRRTAVEEKAHPAGPIGRGRRKSTHTSRPTSTTSPLSSCTSRRHASHGVSPLSSIWPPGTVHPLLYVGFNTRRRPARSKTRAPAEAGILGISKTTSSRRSRPGDSSREVPV